jgi:hypothetical protein
VIEALRDVPAGMAFVVMLGLAGAQAGAVLATGQAATGAALAVCLANLGWWLLAPSGSPHPAAGHPLPPGEGLSESARRRGYTAAIRDNTALREFGSRWLGRYSGAQIALVGAALIGFALLRTPNRLVVNLIGYAVVSAAALWVAQRRAGEPGARAAGLAVALLGFLPTATHVPTPPPLLHSLPGSPFKWTAGWPSTEWAFRHEIQLARPLDRPARLVAIRDRPPAGVGQVQVSLGGTDLGAMREAAFDVLELHIPAERLAGMTRLSFELRLTAPDPTLRLVAHRWIYGATLGAGASSFYDGSEWRRGTYDDRTGRVAGGAYLIELQPQ